MEKQAPLLPTGTAPEPRQRSFWVRRWPITVLLSLGALHYGLTTTLNFQHYPHSGPVGHRPHSSNGGQCRQVDPLTPVSSPGTSPDALENMEAYITSDAFRNETVKRMAGAIQIPSMSYDDLGPVGEDPRWEIMYDMAAYLEKTFPLVHANLRREKVNTHGLLYTWEGSDPALKPTVLMAHQDVVPVAEDTAGDWTHPPFSGAYDGKFIWGRGASDCKDQLIGSLESIELLLGAGYAPRRTVVLSYGFDEEISGRQGAGHLSAAILARYGEDGVSVIVDEGSGVKEQWGTAFAIPGVAEKGYLDVEVAVRTPGGHSSVPPAHTGIGILAQLISEIEAHPYEPRLAPENPVVDLLSCGAEHADEFPSKLRKLLPGAEGGRKHGHHGHGKKDKLAKEVAKMGPATKYLFTTSLATDIVHGGVKVNALPERVYAVVNHRINVGETTDEVKAKLSKVVKKVADRHNLTLHAFDDEEEETVGSVILRETGIKLEPAPVTPTLVDGTTAYSVLAGTTRALYGEELVVAPGIMTGNTDTRYYWALTRNIFRFSPGWDPAFDSWKWIHTVDERVSVEAHLNTVQWYVRFIRNMDEADLA
ncbi:related to CPS1 - gly-X carboxypeptidase YSCS precursor [Cephalotrichum gorgonifer]|uniref:Related to CPS1 - gly-X carboxypeptidase YSCS n=1 Tax=Cephalotrichum gorgonifer TaxID=2041049 RepID=A0AAE8N539_9PEZI|nr:related to CPS1 - gly-X carboxypeptidase YSCS precursor [Cephalotrichum gorgonifer]